MDDDVKFYTVEEVAKIYRVSYCLILKAIKQGRLRAFKITDGKRSPYRIASHELIIFQANGCEESINED